MTQKNFQNANLTDALVFAMAMEDSENCRDTLQVILQKKLGKFKVHVEHSLLFNSDYRSIRLDVYGEDEAGDTYNLEMQNENEKNLAKRSRYHQAEMDTMSIPPGSNFNDLKPNHVIFICTFDPFGRGLYQYTFENRCRETGEPLGDETTKIYLNTKGRNPEQVSEHLVNLLKYMENSTDKCAEELNDDVVSKLHTRVKALKKSRTWEERYMTVGELMDRKFEQGLEQGKGSERSRVNELNKRLAELRRTDDIVKAAGDPKYQEQLFQEFNL